MKIECSRQLWAGQTDRRTDRVTPWAPQSEPKMSPKNKSALKHFTFVNLFLNIHFFGYVCNFWKMLNVDTRTYGVSC